MSALELSIRLHDRVHTPNGVGLAQGLVRKEGQPDRLLVSHKQHNIPKEVWAAKNPYNGPFILLAYPLDQVSKAL